MGVIERAQGQATRIAVPPLRLVLAMVEADRLGPGLVAAGRWAPFCGGDRNTAETRRRS